MSNLNNENLEQQRFMMPLGNYIWESLKSNVAHLASYLEISNYRKSDYSNHSTNWKGNSQQATVYPPLFKKRKRTFNDNELLALFAEWNPAPVIRLDPKLNVVLFNGFAKSVFGKCYRSKQLFALMPEL